MKVTKNLTAAATLGGIQFLLLTILAQTGASSWNWELDDAAIIFWWGAAGSAAALFQLTQKAKDPASDWGQPVYFTGLALTFSPLLGSCASSDVTGVLLGAVGLLIGLICADTAGRFLVARLGKHPGKLGGFRWTVGAAGALSTGFSLPAPPETWVFLRLLLLLGFLISLILILYPFARRKAIHALYNLDQAPPADLAYGKIGVGTALLFICLFLRLSQFG